MMSTIFLVSGMTIGGILVWILASSRLKSHYAGELSAVQIENARRIAELESISKSAEAVVKELRPQIIQREEEINKIRTDLEREKSLRTEALARLDETGKSLNRQKELLEEMKTNLGESFKALSLDALAKNSDEFKKYADEFIRLAEEKLKSQTVEGSKELEGKRELIDQNIEKIGKTLSEVQKKMEEMGKASGEKFSEVSTLIRKHEEVTFKLKDTTEHLGRALASSKKRGEWGERMAEDIIRLVGMSEGISYIKQKTLEHSSGRPDFTFLLPNELKINMDVKFPMDNYQHYLDADSEHDKKRFRDELLKNARLMIRQVTSREYINPIENTVDYVIMFIPNEQVYSFIHECDTSIMDEALRHKVILCSPFTLYAVLAVIRQAVENFNLEKTASEILKLLAEFSKQWDAYKDKFRVMGEKLESCRKEYDAIVTTRTNMLERPLKKIEDLRRQNEIAFGEELKIEGTSLL